jgi:SAM-dependent methyltransferase
MAKPPAPDFAPKALLAALRAVAEPTRLRIFALCQRVELSVSDLTQILGQSQPRVSRHLKVLCAAEVLERLREGTYAFYRVPTDGIGPALAKALLPLYGGTELEIKALEDLKQRRYELASPLSAANGEKLRALRRYYPDEQKIDQALLRALPVDSVRDLLDIGTGVGHMLELFGPRVTHAMGIDLSRDMLSLARAKLTLADLQNCRVQQADMYQLPLPSESVDAVTIHHVLHFAERPAQVIAEAARMLRASGRLVIVDFVEHDVQKIRDGFQHRWPGFQPSAVQAWCEEAGLQVMDLDIIHDPSKPLKIFILTAQRSQKTSPRKRPKAA